MKRFKKNNILFVILIILCVLQLLVSSLHFLASFILWVHSIKPFLEDNAIGLWREAKAATYKDLTGGAGFFWFWVTFLIWLYRSRKNLDLLGAKDLQFSPGWTVGWFFIPIANLWMPYKTVREVWKASVVDQPVNDNIARLAMPASVMLKGWWGTALLSSLVATTRHLSQYVGGWIELLPCAAGFISTVLILTLVQQIRDKQIKKYNKIIE